MKLFISIFLFLTSTSTPEWQTDFNKAQQQAIESKKMILMNFSGSDWCGPCIRMHKEIFSAEAFNNYAAEHLILVGVDFPRLKKNQLSKEQTMKNELLADKYNRDGKFPVTVLLDANGKVLKQWNGLPKESPEKFIEEIKLITHGPS